MGSPPGSRRWIVLLLQLVALVAAMKGQLSIVAHPWLSIVGLCFGAALFFLAERLVPATPEPTGGPAQNFRRAELVLLGVGCVLCVAAGVLVQRQAEPRITHALWFLGLLLMVLCAVLPRRRAASPAPRPGPVRLALVVLLGVSAVMLVWHLSSTPPEVHNDEAEIGNDAIHLLTQRPFNLFKTGWYSVPMFHAVPAALGIKLFGVNQLGLRAASAAMGVVSVLLLFDLAYAWWGLDTAFVAGLLLASQRFFIHLSRTGYHYIGTPFISVVTAWLAWRLWCERRLSTAIWCGIVLGLGIQGYYASRIVPVLLTLTWACWLFRSERTLIRSRLASFAVVAVVAMATAAPIIGFYCYDWSGLMGRTISTSVFTEPSIANLSNEYRTNRLSVIVLIQLWRAFTVFNLWGDTSVQYSYGDGGLFEPISAALFMLGVGAVCARPLRWSSLLVLPWVILPVLIGGALTINTPFYPRLSGVVPFAVLIVAIAVGNLLASIRTALPRTLGAWAAPVVAMLLLAGVYASNVYTYFMVHCPRLRRGGAVEMSEFILAHGAGKTSYMVRGGSDSSLNHGTILFLTYGYDKQDINDLEPFLQQHHLDAAKSVFIIMPPAHDLLPKLVAAVGPLTVEEQRDMQHSTVLFYTGIPQATAPSGPAS